MFSTFCFVLRADFLAKCQIHNTVNCVACFILPSTLGLGHLVKVCLLNLIYLFKTIVFFPGKKVIQLNIILKALW